MSRSTFIAKESMAGLRLVLQVRVANERSPRLIWNGIYIRMDPLNKCPLCNIGAQDSFAHLILDCPVTTFCRPESVMRLSREPAPETVRLDAVLNTRRLIKDRIIFLPPLIRYRDFADHVPSLSRLHTPLPSLPTRLYSI